MNDHEESTAVRLFFTKTQLKIKISVIFALFVPGFSHAAVITQPLFLVSSTHCIAVQANVLDTPRARQIGFSGQPTSSARALLFQWDQPTARQFWMHNTHVPILLFRLSDAGGVQQMNELIPLDSTTNADQGSGRFALEVRIDQLDERSIQQLKQTYQVDGLHFDPTSQPPNKACGSLE